MLALFPQWRKSQETPSHPRTFFYIQRAEEILEEPSSALVPRVCSRGSWKKEGGDFPWIVLRAGRL